MKNVFKNIAIALMCLIAPAGYSMMGSEYITLLNNHIVDLSTHFHNVRFGLAKYSKEGLFHLIDLHKENAYPLLALGHISKDFYDGYIRTLDCFRISINWFFTEYSMMGDEGLTRDEGLTSSELQSRYIKLLNNHITDLSTNLQNVRFGRGEYSKEEILNKIDLHEKHAYPLVALDLIPTVFYDQYISKLEELRELVNDFFANK